MGVKGLKSYFVEAFMIFFFLKNSGQLLPYYQQSKYEKLTMGTYNQTKQLWQSSFIF